MATDFIKIDTTSAAATLSGALKNAINTQQQAYAQLLNIRQKMSHMNDGVNFSQLETLFGLPTGKGQASFDLVNGSVGAIEGTLQNNNIKTLTEQIG